MIVPSRGPVTVVIDGPDAHALWKALFATGHLSKVVNHSQHAAKVVRELYEVAHASRAGSAQGTSDAEPAEPAKRSEYVTTKEAARILGIGSRAVIKRIQNHQLDGDKDANGRWRIPRSALKDSK